MALNFDHGDSCLPTLLAAYEDRMSTRGIQRTFGVCYQTLRRWVGEKIRSLPAFEDTRLPSEKGDVLEWDELWSFVYKKAQECWWWLALCRGTRQVVADAVSDRSQAGAIRLREHVPEGYRRRATRSDDWLAYAAAFPRRTHQSSVARRQAKPTTPNAALAPCAHG